MSRRATSFSREFGFFSASRSFRAILTARWRAPCPSPHWRPRLHRPEAKVPILTQDHRATYRSVELDNRVNTVSAPWVAMLEAEEVAARWHAMQRRRL